MQTNYMSKNFERLKIKGQTTYENGQVPLVSSSLQQLIPVVNRLQDVMASIESLLNNDEELEIDLPQIAVIGSQSVGKSSVLESLVGRDFLPRGVGMITRRPLILQLHQIEPTRKPFAEFGHLPSKTFTDFDAVRIEIQLETDRLAPHPSLSPQPILLKIYSPDVIDLTLVDLPGITKVPVGGQSTDVETQIQTIIMQFIKKPNCLILAVSAANTDLTNSDALKLAREVDPLGVRTLGVITKCDIMDAGTDAVAMLTGNIYPLERGYVGVVCRNQQQISSNVPLHVALEEEEAFFRNHSSYRSFASRCGTQYLAIVLNQTLMYHIKETLPDLQLRIQRALCEAETNLQSYGTITPNSRSNKGSLLLEFITQFSKRFQDSIDGRLTALRSTTELAGGARLNYIFHDWFGKSLSMFDPLATLTRMEIRTVIRNATGPKATLFVPEGAFEILVRKQIEQLLEPSLRCVDQVHEELQKFVEDSKVEEVARYPTLKRRIIEVMRSVLSSCLGPTHQMIKNLIQMELAYCNTNHPDFLIIEDFCMFDETTKLSKDKLQQNKISGVPSLPGAAPALPELSSLRDVIGKTGFRKMGQHCTSNGSTYESYIDQKASRLRNNNNNGVSLPHVPKVVLPPYEMSERESIEIELMEKLIVSYFNIVRKNVADYVPKAIMSFMVNTSKEAVQRELVTQLYKEEIFDELLCESAEVTDGRKACTARIDGLKTALQIVNELGSVDMDD